MGIVAASLALVATLARAGLEELKTICDREVERIEKEAHDGQRQVIARYGSALVSLRKTSSKSGALEAVLALDKEIKRFETERTLPSTPSQGFPIEAEDTLAKAAAAVQAVAAQKDRELAELFARYASRLRALQKQLVTEDKLDEAVAVETELGRVEFLAADLAARMKQREAAKPEKVVNSVTARFAGRVEANTDEVLPAELKRGLVVYYSFDTEQGATVSDESGEGNDGELHGASWTSEGKKGGGYRFEVGNDIEIGSGKDLDRSALTVAFWACPRTAGRSIVTRGISRRQAMRSRDWDFCGNGRELLFVLATGRKAEVQVEGTAFPTINEWHHIAATWNVRGGKGETILYLNGKRVASRSLSGIEIQNRSNIYVGGRGRYAYQGLLDEFMIWARALSDDEMKQAYELAGGE